MPESICIEIRTGKEQRTTRYKPVLYLGPGVWLLKIPECMCIELMKTYDERREGQGSTEDRE